MNLDAITSLRATWTFQYRAAEVAEGAAKQREYRKGRQHWWAEKKAEVMEKVRAEGITISESVADQLATANYHSTRTIGPQVHIKPELLQQLQECHTKIDVHRRAVEEYDGWVQVLTAPANVNRTLELTQEDWLFFFGKV